MSTGRKDLVRYGGPSLYGSMCSGKNCSITKEYLRKLKATVDFDIYRGSLKGH